jgi:hypothetical protein
VPICVATGGFKISWQILWLLFLGGLETGIVEKFNPF